MKSNQIKVIKKKDVEERSASRDAAEAAAADSQAAIRRGRRSGTSVVNSWITERRETARLARISLLKQVAIGLLK